LGESITLDARTGYDQDAAGPDAKATNAPAERRTPRSSARAGRRALRGSDRASHPIERRAESLRVDRLQHVVQGVVLEGPNGVLVERGDHDRGRQLTVHAVHRGHDVESVDLGHLDVEEHHVRAQLAHPLDGLRAAAALGHDGEARVGLDERAHGAASERLVVDDDRPDRPISHRVRPRCLPRTES